MEKDFVLRHGSLFSGIGGFDLAAEWCGWKNIFHCEINEFCNRILVYYWPKAAAIKNIIGYEWEKWKGKIDVLSGGFPCQPYSLAGKRLGKADPRHLWPYMLKAIRTIRPQWVVGENVRGLISWNEGLVFDEVQADLEAAGYEVIPFLLPAAGVGAPHRRERIWFVAYANGNNDFGKKRDGIEKTQSLAGRPGPQDSPGRQSCRANHDDPSGRGMQQYDATNAYGDQRSQRRGNKERPEEAKRQSGKRDARFVRNSWENFPSQPALCNGDDGLSGQLDHLAFSKWRSESLKAGGNAIVPQVAYQLFKAIEELSGSFKRGK